MRVKLRLNQWFYSLLSVAEAVDVLSRIIYRKTMHEQCIGEGGVNG